MFFYRNNDIISKILQRHLKEKYGLEINSKNIVEGLYLGHPYLITVNPSVVIGKNCNLHKGVTIGQENRGKRKGVPSIGDDVWIGINSSIVGKIKIGNNVLIAPNSYVNFDVPSNSVVIGNPGKIFHNNTATDGYIQNRIWRWVKY